MKFENIYKSVVLLLNFIILLLFIFSLIIMTSDAQGALVFIFTIPIISVLSFIAILLSKKLNQVPNLFLLASKFLIVGLFLFCFAGLVPVLKEVPLASLDLLTQGFTKITGKTPRQYFRDRNDLNKLIQSQLAASANTQIDFSKISTAHQWTRLCIFTPYTSDSVADQITGLQFKLSQYSDLASSDSIHFIALFDEHSLVNYVNMNRSVIDFEFTDSICLSKEKAVLYRQTNGRFKF